MSMYRPILIAAAILVGNSAHGFDSRYPPDDTERVAAVNLKQTFNSEMLKARPDAEGELKELLKQFAGIDLVETSLKGAGIETFRDLDQVTFAFPAGKDARVGILALDGKFDAAKIDGSPLRITQSGNRTRHEITPRGGKPPYAALAGATTLVAAPTPEALAGALARVSDASKSGLKPELKKRIDATEGRESVRFVSAGPAFAQLLDGVSIPNAELLVRFSKTLEVLSGRITLGKDLRAQIGVNTENEDAAKKPSESANGAARIPLTLVGQSAEKDKKDLPLIDVVKTFRFDSQGKVISFRGEANLDSPEKLINHFPIDQAIRDRK